jgi:hypothetical protein
LGLDRPIKSNYREQGLGSIDHQRSQNVPDDWIFCVGRVALCNHSHDVEEVQEED